MLSTNLNNAFLSRMAEIHPLNAFSCLRGESLKERFLSVEEWIEKNHLHTSKSIEMCLRDQLGKPWSSLEDQPSVRQAALILFASYASGENIKESLADLNRWSASITDGVSPCNPMTFISSTLIRAAEPVIQRIAQKHAWSETVSQAIIQCAKNSNGVMPNSYYLWLSHLDRPLWLLLSNYGRRQPLIEVLGVVHHTTTESTVGHPIKDFNFKWTAQQILSKVSNG